VATVPVEMTAVAGAVLTAAQWNSNVRDAINFIIAPPLALLRQTVSQSIANGAWVPVNLDTEDLDRDNAHSTVTNTSRYTAQTAGYYSYQGCAHHGINTTGIRSAVWRPNGGAATTYKNKLQVPASPAGTTTAVLTHATFFQNVGDYVELMCFQNSGGALSLYVTDEGNPSMNALWISS